MLAEAETKLRPRSIPVRTHTYRPDVDGLRAVAIFIVVLYHLGNLSKGGFIGVDVFFVISGFVITNVILSDVANGTFTLAGFYERRVRRLLPALVTVLTASLIAAYLFLFPAEFVFFAKSLFAAIFFSANHFFLATSGYFQANALPLIHTWSLSVEEQFYLIFPIVLLPLLARRRGPAFVILLAVAVSSLVLSTVLVRTAPNAAFYFLPTRAWELLLGSLLALGAVPALRTQRSREVLSAVGLLAIFIPAFAFNKNTPFPGLAALLPCLGAAALIHTGSGKDTGAYRMLASKPFVFMGLISYSLYLWHVPLITFYRLEIASRTSYPVKTMLFLVAVALAVLSWKYIEQPFRKRSLAPTRWKAFSYGAVAAGTVAAVALAVIYTDGVKNRYPPAVRELAAFQYVPRGPMRDGSCFISRAASKTSSFDPEHCLALDASRKNVLILGDSHAAHLWAGFNATHSGVNYLQATASGCASDFVISGSQRCRQVMSYLFDEFLPGKTLDAIIIAMNWSPGTGPGLLETIQRLRPHAKEIYVFGPIVRYRSPLPRLLTQSALRNDPDLVDEARLQRTPKIDDTLRELFAGTDVRYVSLLDVLCPHQTCITLDGNGKPLQYDGAHLTADGSAQLARMMSEHLAYTR